MMRSGFLSVVRIGICLAVIPIAPSAQSIGEARAPIATETVSFEERDVQAAGIARQMYGQEFSYIRAVRVWLEAPSDAPEQLFLQVGNGRNCDTGCSNIALFHNGQWLEIYRQPAARILALSPVTLTGMKSIVADGRVWSWNATNYVPEPIRDGLEEREPSETDLALVSEQIGGGFSADAAAAFGPPDVSVYEVELNGYPGKIIAVRSPYVCGQSSCPVYLINGQDQIFRVLRSLEGEVGLSRDFRDEQGLRGIELVTRNGIKVVSSTSGKTLGSVPVQSILVAGEAR